MNFCKCGGYSGSTYKCHKNQYGRGLNFHKDILKQMDKIPEIEILDVMPDIMNIEWGIN